MNVRSRIYIYLCVIFYMIPICARYIPEREIVVVIPSYNNIQWYERNLKSIYNQEYTNYRVVYWDDCSTDGTYDAVCKVVSNLGQEFRTEVHRNIERKGALYGIYHAVHAMSDPVIFVNLDGDDWFHTNQALRIINAAYADSNVWMTYGQYVHYPSGKPGTCKPYPASVIETHAYRGYGPHDGILSHPRTCYAWLFKCIKKEDLLDASGKFYTAALDLAYMMPLIEMAHKHCKFIPDILYEYNQDNQINVFKTRVSEQIKNARHVHYEMPQYAALQEKPAGLEHPGWLYWDFDQSMKRAEFSVLSRVSDSVIGYSVQYFYDKAKELYNKNNPSMIPASKEPTIPKIIHQIWIGSPLPKEYEAHMRSWVQHHLGDEWTYILWTDETVEKIKPLYNQKYYDEHPNYGVKADILKWELIYRYGGVYADLDQECLANFDLFHHRYDFYCSIQPLEEMVPQLGASLFAARPGHPLLKHCIETIKNDWHRKGAPAKTGPIHMTKSFLAMAGKDDSKDVALPAHYFFPYSDHAFARGTAQLDPQEWKNAGCFAAHHWAKSWMPAHLRLPAHRNVKNEATTEGWNN